MKLSVSPLTKLSTSDWVREPAPSPAAPTYPIPYAAETDTGPSGTPIPNPNDAPGSAYTAPEHVSTAVRLSLGPGVNPVVLAERLRYTKSGLRPGANVDVTRPTHALATF